VITSDVPGTWQDLQDEAANILRECGFAVEVEKKLQTARGEVEVDVYAEETVKGRRYVILCECKHWASRVPQTVIHAFRTTVSDLGANVGYVISTSGFQAGAFAASELTNLQLTTWLEFQNAFEESWIQEHFIKRLAEQLDPFLTYTEPLLPTWFDALPSSEQDAFIALKDKHDPMGHLVMALSPYVRAFRHEPLPALPLKDSLHDKADSLRRIPQDVVEATGYKQLFDLLIQHGTAAIADFRAIRDRNAMPNEE